MHEEDGRKQLAPGVRTELLDVAPAERSAEVAQEDEQRGVSTEVLA